MRHAAMMVLAGLGLVPVPAGAAAANTTAEAELLAVDDREREMVLTDNATEMRKLAHPDLHINAPTNEVLDRTEFLRRLENRIIEFEKLKRIPEKVVITGNVGIIMGREEVFPTASSESGKMFGVRQIVRRYTNIYVRENGQWRFLARHANVAAAPAAPRP